MCYASCRNDRLRMFYMSMRQDAEIIVRESIAAVMPDEAVRSALAGFQHEKGRVVLAAIGKAGWQMAAAAEEYLKDRISEGIVITKYRHVLSDITNIKCFEAGHPIPDENAVKATVQIEEMVNGLTEDDTVLFLVSGGGSALFTDPAIPLEELQMITDRLLKCGADIREINTVRKHLDKVKGGRFAKLCEPASVFSIILSDIVGDPLDMIASGPAYPDTSTSEQAVQILQKYHIEVSAQALHALAEETPSVLTNVETHVTGSVKKLCLAAAETCRRLGYEPIILSTSMTCMAADVGRYMASIAKAEVNADKNIAYIAGGETVVCVKGNGLGGRNQEIVLSAAVEIAGMPNTAVLSFGSDGTDGPTDAAGGYADGETAAVLADEKVSIAETLGNNDSYHALEKCGGLIKTGPTGTNVNDVTILLIRNA